MSPQHDRDTRCLWRKACCTNPVRTSKKLLNCAFECGAIIGPLGQSLERKIDAIFARASVTSTYILNRPSGKTDHLFEDISKSEIGGPAVAPRVLCPYRWCSAILTTSKMHREWSMQTHNGVAESVRIAEWVTYGPSGIPQLDCYVGIAENRLIFKTDLLKFPQSLKIWSL